MNRLQLAFLTFLFGISTLTAQQSISYTNETSDFDRAVALYKEKQYQAARIIFEKVQNKTSESEIKNDCAYYIAKPNRS
jgi:TolA-binding protein